MSSRHRTALAAVVVVVVALVFGAMFSFLPLVRRAASSRAERYGAAVTVERAWPTWSGVRLEDVRVTLADAPGVAVTLSSVVVEGGRVGPVSAIRVVGGRVVLRGTPDELRAQARAVAARPRPAGASGPGASLEVSGISLAWSFDKGDEIRAEALGARRGEGTVTLVVGSAAVNVGPSRAALVDGTVTLRRGDTGAWQLAELVARSVEGDITLGVVSPADSLPDGEERSVLARVGRQRDRLAAGALALAHSLAPGAKVRIGEASIVAHRGEEVLHAGPGELRLDLSDESIGVSLTPTRAGSGASPFQLAAEIPLDRRKELAVTVRGGPVSLASLGFREGDMGLFDVGKANLEAGGKVSLSGDARHVELALQGKVRGLSLRNARLSSQPVSGLEIGFAVTGGGDLDGARVRVDKGELDVGTVRAELSGDFEREATGFHVRGKAAVPLASCQGMLDALPGGLAPRLAGMKMTGTFAVHGKIDFDSRRADASIVDLSLINECRVTHAPPEIDVAHFRAPHRRRVYAPDGARVEVDAGPGTPTWVPYGSISPFMEAAVLTTEDGRFRGHRGFDVEALRNSVRENLKAGRFVRGGSTISMQTAKNVYLEREKTLARKLEEAVLTSYLEQALSKEQLLELYLNSIEFGPMIYGIGPAAAHYFHTSAAELSLGQALYLSSILPNPKVSHFEGGGRVTPQWMGYLHRLMRGMAKRHLVSEADVADGLAEWVVFGVPRPPRAHVDGDSPVPDDVPALEDQRP